MRITEKAIKRRMIVYAADLVLKVIITTAVIVGTFWVCGALVHILVGG